MQAKKARRWAWLKFDQILIYLSLTTFATATIITQSPSLNLAFQATARRLMSINLFQPLGINRIDEGGGCKDGYTETADGGCVKTPVSPKPKASTKPKTSSKPKSSPQSGGASGCGSYTSDECAGVAGCKVSGNRCVTDTKASSSPTPTPAPTPSAPPGESCTGTNKNVKVQDGQYAYSGGVDSDGDYTCYQCQNGTWSEAGKCQKLHEDGKNVVAPPTDTAEGEEGGTRRNNCSDQQNGVYVTVGDGATRADGKKCMNGSWVDPAVYKPPDYVKPSPNPDASPGSQSPPPTTPATGGASCSTSYDTGHGPVNVTIPNGESALGGAATTTETGERTAVKICQNGQFVPCNEANRAGAPAVTNCTTPTVLPNYMTEGQPSQATCSLSGGYQLPAGRAVPGETGSQVCKNGKMETIPVSPNDVGNYLLGTTAGTTPAMLADMQALCLSYGNTNCTGDGLTAFATDWLESADPAFAVEVEHRREVADLFDVATGQADAATKAALATDCKTQLGHTCSTTELSDFALKQLQTTDPAAYDQAVDAIAEAKKIQDQANFVYQFYVNPNDEDARKKVLALCQQEGGDCAHLETFAKSELATYDPTGALLQDANTAKDKFADTTTLFNVATGQASSAETSTLKQECLRDNALNERESDVLSHDCNSTAGLSEYALDTLEEIDPVVANQAVIANDPQGYLEQKLNTCRHSCSDTSHNCAINEVGNAVCVDLRTVDPNIGNLTKSLGTRFDFNTFSNVNCGGLGQPCCIDQLNQDAVFKLTTSTQSCTTGTSCSGGTQDSFGSCSYDVAYSRSQATTALIQSRISGPNPADSETINKIIQNNAYVDPQSVSALSETTTSLCKASCGDGGVCAYSDSSHSYSCQRLTGNSLTQAYSQATANLPSYNDDPDSGALGQSCYRPTWFHLGAGSCDNDYLACESGTCEISDTGQSLLTVNSVSKSSSSININLANAGTEVAHLSTFVQTDPHLNSTGCNQSYSTYTSNNSCFICWDSHSKSVQAAPDPAYCSNPDMAKTLPGRSCNASGGYCAGNDTIATGGVTRTGQSDCPSSMQCFKYAPPALGFAAGTPSQSRPGIGNSCNNAHPDSICANGLTCINGLCVDQISASFNSTYQEGLIAHGIRTNETINSIPAVNFIVDHVIAPITAAIDPDYHRATTVQADVAHSMVTNVLSQPSLQATLPDDFVLNMLETLHGDAKVKYQLSTLEAINANSDSIVAGTGAYSTLANISFFTGAWTERYTVPQGYRATADIPSGPPVDNAFYGYAYNYAQSNAAHQDSSYLGKVFTAQGAAGAASFGVEIAFTAADFLTPPGLSDSLTTVIAKNANEALVSRAAGSTVRETAQVVFREAAQKGTTTAFVQATATVVTDAALRGIGTVFSRPQVWGEAIESGIGRTVSSAVTQTGLTTFVKTTQNNIITGAAQIATSVGLTTISNSQAIKTFTQGLSNLASGLLTGLEKVAYSVGNTVGITSATYENKTLVDSLIKTLDITGDNLVHLSSDDLFEYAVSTGYKGTQAQFAQEILVPLQVKVLQNTPASILSTLTVPPDSLDPKMIEQIYLSTGIDFTAEAQSTFLLQLSKQYGQNPYDLKVLSDLMAQSREMGITLAEDQIVPFTRTMLQLTSDFPQTGPLSRNALQLVAQSNNLTDTATRSLILGLETTQSPLILPLTRSFNLLSPTTLLQTREVVSEAGLATRLQGAGVPAAQATNLAGTVLHNNPPPTLPHVVTAPTPVGGAITPTVKIPRHEDANIIAGWFDPQTQQLSKVKIEAGKILPIPGQALSHEEEALIVSLNQNFEILRQASGFTSLRDEQVDADLRTILKVAQTPDDTNLKIILNPTTGGGKNTVVVPLLAQYDLERGNLFIEGVNAVQLEDAFKRDTTLASLYGRDNIFQITRETDGSVVVKDLDGHTINPTDISTRISLLKAKDPSAKPFKLTMQTDQIGFALNDVIALEAGESVANPALAKMWADVFSMQPSANIDEIGTLTGRWMTSTGTPTPVAQLLGEQSLGLTDGGELLDIFARSATDPIVLEARAGQLTLTRNLQTQALEALPLDTNRRIIESSLQQGIDSLPANSPALPVLQKVLSETDNTTLTTNFDALRRSSLAELQSQFDTQTATELYNALRVADGYNDAVYSRLSVISMVPGDDYAVADGLVQLAQDKGITKQQYSAPMQALALQDEGALKLEYKLCPTIALLTTATNVLGDAVGCLLPLGQIEVNPRSITSDSNQLFDRLGNVYATDATDALPRAKFGFTTLYDSIPLHEPQVVQTAATLADSTKQLGSAINTKLQNNEIAMVVDMKAGAATGQNLDTTTLATLRATQAELPRGQQLYLALMNGDGTQSLYKVDPTKLARATSLEEIGTVVAHDLTPEELYAKSLDVMGTSSNNKVVAYFQDRTRATNFKPASGDPPKTIISETLVLGDANTFIKDTTFQSAGRLRGYAASPYSLYLTGTSETLTPTQAVSRALANQAQVTGEEATARVIADLTTNQSRSIVSALRSTGNSNPSFLAELSQFERQISEAGLAYPTTPIKQTTLNVLFDEYQTSISRNRAILERARIAGVDPNLINQLSERYGLNNPLTLDDFHAALSGSLQPGRGNNARNTLIANLNEIGSSLPGTYTRGSRNTMALADIARSVAPTPTTTPPSLTSRIGSGIRQATGNVTATISRATHNLTTLARSATTRALAAISSRSLTNTTTLPTSTLLIPTPPTTIDLVVNRPNFTSLVITDTDGNITRIERQGNDTMYSYEEASDEEVQILSPAHPLTPADLSSLPTSIESIRYNDLPISTTLYAVDASGLGTLTVDLVALTDLLQDPSFNSLIFTLNNGHTVDVTSLRNNPAELANFLPNAGQIRLIRYNGIDLPASYYHEASPTLFATTAGTPLLTRIRTLLRNLVTRATPTLPTPVVVIPAITTPIAQVDNSIQPFIDFWVRDIPDALSPLTDFIRSRARTLGNTAGRLLIRFGERQQSLFNPTTLTFPRGVDLNTGRFRGSAYFASFLFTNTPWHQINHTVSDLTSGRLNLATASTRIQALNLDSTRRDQIVNALAITYPARTAPTPIAPPAAPTTKVAANLNGQALNIDLSKSVTLRPHGFIDAKHAYTDTFSSTYASATTLEQQFDQTRSRLLSNIQGAVDTQRLSIDKVTATIDITYTDHNGKRQTKNLKLNTSGITNAPTPTATNDTNVNQTKITGTGSIDSSMVYISTNGITRRSNTDTSKSPTLRIRNIRGPNSSVELDMTSNVPNNALVTINNVTKSAKEYFGNTGMVLQHGDRVTFGNVTITITPDLTRSDSDPVSNILEWSVEVDPAKDLSSQLSQILTFTGQRRDAALAAFQTKLNSRYQAILHMRDLVITNLKKNPRISKDKVLDQLLTEGQKAGLSNAEINNTLFAVDQFMNSYATVLELKRQYPDPAKLWEAAFGFKPTHKPTIRAEGGSITFVTDHKIDFAKAYFFNEDTKTTKALSNEEVNEAERYSGFHLNASTRIPNTANIFNVAKYSGNTIDLNDTVAHEVQHALFSSLAPALQVNAAANTTNAPTAKTIKEQFESVNREIDRIRNLSRLSKSLYDIKQWWQKITGQTPIDPNTALKSSIKQFAFNMRLKAEQDVADEILAQIAGDYIANGNFNQTARDVVTDNLKLDSYKYFERARDSFHSVLAGVTSDELATQNLDPYYTSKAQEALVQQALGAYEVIINKGYTHSDAIVLLQTSRLAFWRSLARHLPDLRSTTPAVATSIAPPVVTNTKVQVKLGNRTIKIDLSVPTFISTKTNVDGKAEEATYQPTFSTPAELTAAISESQSTAAEHLVSTVQSQGLTHGSLSASVTLTYTDHDGTIQTLTLPVDTSSIQFAAPPPNLQPTTRSSSQVAPTYLTYGVSERRYLTPYGVGSINRPKYLTILLGDMRERFEDWTIDIFNTSPNENVVVTLNGSTRTILSNASLTLHHGDVIVYGGTTLTFRGISKRNGRYSAQLDVLTGADPLSSLSDPEIKSFINQEFSNNPNLSTQSYIDPSTPTDYQALRNTFQKIRDCQLGNCAPATTTGLSDRSFSMFGKTDLAVLNTSQLVALAARTLYINTHTNPADTIQGKRALQKIAQGINTQLAKLGKTDHFDPANLRPESAGHETRLSMGRGESLGVSRSNDDGAEIDIEVLQSLPESEQLAIAAHEAMHQAQRIVQATFNYEPTIPNRTYTEIFTEWYTRGYLAPGHWLYRHSISYSVGVKKINATLDHIRTHLGLAAYQDALALFEDVAYTGDFGQINAWFARHNMPTIADIFAGVSDYHFRKKSYPRDNSTWTDFKNWLIKTTNPKAYTPPTSAQPNFVSPHSPPPSTPVARLTNNQIILDLDLSSPILVSYGSKWDSSNWTGNWFGSPQTPQTVYSNITSLQQSIDAAAQNVRANTAEAAGRGATNIQGVLAVTYTDLAGNQVTTPLSYQFPTTVSDPNLSPNPTASNPTSELIGRDPANGNLGAKNEVVSRSHALVTRDLSGNVIGITDYDSANGTRVNNPNTRITGYTPLVPGDIVYLGPPSKGTRLTVKNVSGRIELVTASNKVVNGQAVPNQVAAPSSHEQDLLNSSVTDTATRNAKEDIESYLQSYSINGASVGINDLTPISNNVRKRLGLPILGNVYTFQQKIINALRKKDIPAAQAVIQSQISLLSRRGYRVVTLGNEDFNAAMLQLGAVLNNTEAEQWGSFVHYSGQTVYFRQSDARSSADLIENIVLMAHELGHATDDIKKKSSTPISRDLTMSRISEANQQYFSGLAYSAIGNITRSLTHFMVSQALNGEHNYIRSGTQILQQVNSSIPQQQSPINILFGQFLQPTYGFVPHAEATNIIYDAYESVFDLGRRLAEPLSNFFRNNPSWQEFTDWFMGRTLGFVQNAQVINYLTSLPESIVARVTGRPTILIPPPIDTTSWVSAEEKYLADSTAKAPKLASIYADPSSRLPAFTADINAYVEVENTAFQPISSALPLSDAISTLHTQARAEVERLFNNPSKRVNPDKVKILNDYVDKYLGYLQQAMDEEGVNLDISAIQSLLMTNIHTLTYQDFIASNNLLGDHGLRHLVEHNTTVTLELLELARKQGVPIRAIHFLAAMEVQTNHDGGYAVKQVREGIDQGKFGIDIGHNALAAQILRDKLADPNHPLRQLFSPEILALIHRGILYHDSSSIDMKTSAETAFESAIHIADNTHAFETKLPELLFGYPESLRALRLLKTVGETMDKGEQAELIAQIRADLVRSIESNPTLGADDKIALTKAANLLDPIQYKFNVGRISGHNPIFTTDANGKIIVTAEISDIHQQMLQLFGQEAYLQLAKFIADITGIAKKEEILARMTAGELSFGNEQITIQAVLSQAEVKTGKTEYQRSIEAITDTDFATFNLGDNDDAAQQKLAEGKLAQDPDNAELLAQVATYKQRRLDRLKQYAATLSQSRQVTQPVTQEFADDTAWIRKFTVGDKIDPKPATRTDNPNGTHMLDRHRTYFTGDTQSKLFLTETGYPAIQSPVGSYLISSYVQYDSFTLFDPARSSDRALLEQARQKLQDIEIIGHSVSSGDVVQNTPIDQLVANLSNIMLSGIWPTLDESTRQILSAPWVGPFFNLGGEQAISAGNHFRGVAALIDPRVNQPYVPLDLAQSSVYVPPQYLIYIVPDIQARSSLTQSLRISSDKVDLPAMGGINGLRAKIFTLQEVVDGKLEEYLASSPVPTLP